MKIADILQCIAIILLAINSIRIAKQLYEAETKLRELQQELQRVQRWLR